jgi:hypothetical protein
MLRNKLERFISSSSSTPDWTNSIVKLKQPYRRVHFHLCLKMTRLQTQWQESWLTDAFPICCIRMLSVTGFVYGILKWKHRACAFFNYLIQIQYAYSRQTQNWKVFHVHCSYIYLTQLPLGTQISQCEPRRDVIMKFAVIPSCWWHILFEINSVYSRSYLPVIVQWYRMMMMTLYGKKFWEEILCLLSLHKLTVNNIQCHHLHTKFHPNTSILSNVAPTSEV